MLEGKYSKDIEKDIQEYWKENKIFAFNPNVKKEMYSIDTPPPTVNGSLHMGHIFSYTQAEIIARYKRIMGYNVYYPFGFDDNGLPTERLVEKVTNKRAKDYQRTEFSKICSETAKKYEDEFMDLWSSLGFSVDWGLRYETNNPTSQRISQKSFIELAKKGHAYQKEKPVLWCVNCQTSIAQAELESKESETTFNYIPFFVEDKELIIATTRPEFLAGCRAVMMNPNDPRAEFYKGKMARVPLYNFEVPIILDDGAQLDKGSGVVMCCTYGDNVDVEWSDKYGLSYVSVIGFNGVIEENIEFIGGMYVTKAREKIIELLSEKELLLKQDKIVHSVNTHERCGTEVEILPSNQWYIDVLSKKDLYLKVADQMNWYPSSMKNRYTTWVENLKWDWCISRQRYYGVPFPVWYCKNCNKPHFAEEKDLPVNPLEKEYVGKCECGCVDFYPEKDVMDTWATSSLTPQINAKWRENDQRDYLIPMTMRTQAHEIIRTWAFYTIVKSLYHNNILPWKDLMISGFALAKKGEKISKSKDNSKMTPTSLIERYGADSIRYWTAANKLGTDTWVVEEDIAGSNRFLTKFWNASKFVLMQLEGYNGETTDNLFGVDKWIIDRFYQTQAKYVSYMDEYEVGLARKELDSFFWSDFCDYYLEIAKERLYQPEKHGIEQNISGKQTIYKILLEILKLYSVFIPHECETIYLNYYKNKEKINSICLHEIGKTSFDKNIIETGEKMKYIVSEIRKYKTDKALSLRFPLKNIYIDVEKQDFNFLNSIKTDLMACLVCENVIINLSDKFEVVKIEE